MKGITLLCVGKASKPYYKAAADEYAKRIGRFYALNTAELEERSDIIKESAAVLERIKSDYAVLFDKDGEQMSSSEFAGFLRRVTEDNKNTVFIIGGHAGVDETVKRRAQKTLSLGAGTYPHQLARVMVLEQIYRACTINAGLPYHK